MTLRAYRFNLRTRPGVEALLRRYAGGLRWVWNQAVARQREAHAAGQKYASYVDMAKWLTAPRRPPKLPHLWPPKLLHLAGVI